MNEKSVLILKNVSHEGPGIMEDVLKQNKLKFDIVDLSMDPSIPVLNEYSLLIIMGGPDSANDSSQKIQNELKSIQWALYNDFPVFGICLGLQLIVKAFGGKVIKNVVEETGFRMNSSWNKIRLTSLGAKDPIFKGIDDSFEVFHLHGETVDLIDGINHLGESSYCKYQVIKIKDNNYGFQFHFELNEEMLFQWLELASELRDYDKDLIISDFNQVKDDYIARGKLIFSNFLGQIKLI